MTAIFNVRGKLCAQLVNFYVEWHTQQTPTTIHVHY